MRSFAVDHWQFLLADASDAWKKNFDDSSWRPVRVPHDWSIEQEFSPSFSSGTGYLPGGIGWYRARVSLGELRLTGRQRVRLVFHGVYKNADVWVNGYHLGGRPSGYAELTFDLTEILTYAPDDDLVVSVRVDHSDISDSRWYNGSGITRRVELEVHEEVGLGEHGTTFVTVSVDDDRSAATVRLEQTLVNDSRETLTVRLAQELRSLTSGRAHAFSREVEIPAGESTTVSATERVREPELWSDVDPHLYRLVTTIAYSTAAGDVESTSGETVGIRTFEFDADDGFRINGERRKLKGVCLHEDAGPFGTAVPAEVWVRRLLKLQEMGCNAVRMAHNPHAPELYALCDLLGFYVIDEAFDEWENPKNKWWQGHNVYPPKHEGYAKDFPTWHAADLVNMIDAHKNHPSIVAWSIGNEVDYPNDPYASPLFSQMTGNNDASKPEAERVYDPSRPDIRRLTTIANRLIDIVKEKDPTRSATLAAAFPELSSRTGLLDRLDLVGYNYKEHLYEADHERFPYKPFLGSENSHDYGNWLTVAENDYVSGQFLWTGIDYLGEAHGWPVHGSGAGLLTLAGFEKHTWHLRKSWWSDDPVAYLVTRPHTESGEQKRFWTHPVSRAWDYDAGRAVEVLCFSNCDDLRLTCGDVEIPLSFDKESGYWTAVVPAQAAPLRLECRASGVVVRDQLSRRLEPSRIDAAVWSVPAQVDRLRSEMGIPAGDVVQIECALLDENGRPARGDRLVSVEVSCGALVGLENGDLADNTAYSASSRSTVDGRLMVYVRGSRATTVRLSAPGLPSLAVECVDL